MRCGTGRPQRAGGEVVVVVMTRGKSTHAAFGEPFHRWIYVRSAWFGPLWIEFGDLQVRLERVVMKWIGWGRKERGERKPCL